MVLTAVHPEEECFALVSQDNRLKVWDTVSGSLRQEYFDQNHLSYRTTCIAWHFGIVREFRITSFSSRSNVVLQ